jgi:amino acid adenylation domain-containing protein
MHDFRRSVDSHARRIAVTYQTSYIMNPLSSLPLGEAFAHIARENPGHIAVRAEDGELTYAALDEYSDRLARYLEHLGAGPGSFVAVDPVRRVATIVALLGIVKSGAAYLALERRHPPMLQSKILNDADVQLLLAYGDRPSAPAPELTVVSLDKPCPSTLGHEITLSPEHLAYVAYTSGSMGRPKGVLIPHRAVSRLVLDADFLTVSPEDVFLQLAPLAFDASTLEIWGALLNGACLVLAPARDLTIRELTRYVNEQDVTVLWLTAGLFQQVVDADVGELRKVKHLLAGGDVLSAPHVRRAIECLPEVFLTNGYGPTENTTFTCCHRITMPVGEAVPIGRPIQGTSVRVLNDELEPVPDGEMGELYAAGMGLAHGYLGDPVLTACRFVPDPFADHPGGRMYRTGDLARRRPDGVLDFCGRTDQQLKIRGFRVEPGEVEAALAEIPEVAEAAVVAQKEPDGGSRLVAFVTTARPDPPSPLHLRAQLKETLSFYAMPSVIHPLDELPLTANGKVDRAQLIANRISTRPELSAVYRAPDTALEKTVTELWCDHLGISTIGADDDFFELGGHSLLGVRIINDLSREFGVDISPIEFYLAPTPAGLAAAVRAARTESQTAGYGDESGNKSY